MGWLIALGIIVLLAILPLGVSAKYNADGALVKVIAGPIRITLFPRPKKNKAEKTNKEKKEPNQNKPKQEPAQKEPPKAQHAVGKPEQAQKEKGGSITDFLPLVKVVLDFLGDFGRKLRVNRLELKLILAGDDPCDLAVNYGRAWAAVGNLMPRLERVFDFTESKTKVIARLDLTITLGRLLAAVFVFAFRALVEFLKIKNKRKGGAVNERKSS